MMATMQAKLDALEQSFRDRVSILCSPLPPCGSPSSHFVGKGNAQSSVDSEAAFVTRMHSAHVPHTEHVMSVLVALAADPLT